MNYFIRLDRVYSMNDIQLFRGNQSKMNLQQSEDIVFDEELPHKIEQINPKKSALISQNVPFTKIAHISRWYYAFNIILNVFYLLLLILMPMGSIKVSLRIIVLALTVASYLLYLIAAYKFTNLMTLLSLQPFEEYDSVYEKLVNASITLRFVFIGAKVRIDQPSEKEMLEYKCDYRDNSGNLYDISKEKFQIVFVKYRKKFYYRDPTSKAFIINDFNQFVQKFKKRNSHSRKNLTGKEKIELILKGFEEELGYATEQQITISRFFCLWTFLGFGAYFEHYMKDKILRYEMDITKEVWKK